MAEIRAVTLKLFLTIFITFMVKKPVSTNAFSCCYATNGEIVSDPVNSYYTSSFWIFYCEKVLSLNTKFTLRILLILSGAGDVELCPGSRARCNKCRNCFRKNTDQRYCLGCNELFQRKVFEPWSRSYFVR